MTDPYPPYDPAMLQYQPPSSGPVHIKVAGILNLVMGGLDLMYTLFCTVAAIAFPLLNTNPAPDDPPGWLIGGILGLVALLAGSAGTVKLVAGVKLLKLRPNARGWTLAAGIIGCGQLWCSYLCVLPLGIGIYSIVVASLGSVRAQLLEAGGTQDVAAR